MQDLLTLDEIVTAALVEARMTVKDDSISLAEIHRRCLDLSEGLAPDIIDVLASVVGLQVLVPALLKKPDLVAPQNEELGAWQLVR